MIIILFTAGLISCSSSEVHLQEYLRPIRKLLNKERTYWTDLVEYKSEFGGETGVEIVYYKNGRPALERFFDETDLLKTITYMGRNGKPIRMDSLVYAGEELIGGYYFSEPGHELQMRFLSYKRQGQLSQRSWFGKKNELLSREFFLFDRNGNRRMRMIFDGNDSLLYTESFRPGSDELMLKNTYNVFGDQVTQTIYEPGKPAYRYDFSPQGMVTRISQLHAGGTPAWSSDLLYNAEGEVERSNFSVDGQFLFSHIGDIELFQQSVRAWKHPTSPSQIKRFARITHRDPFVEEIGNDAMGNRTIEYRLPMSGAVFKRSLVSAEDLPVRDSIYSSRNGFHPISVRHFDQEGMIAHETTYDLSGTPKWFHKWFRDDQRRVIREEVSALPDTFAAAVSRFYDTFSLPAFSERFSTPDTFDGTWVFYHGGGVTRTLFYTPQFDLAQSWLLRPGGDTTRHSIFEKVDYIKVESKYGLHDTLLSQLRFTDDRILNWELFFDAEGRNVQEIHRKRDGSIYREVDYDHATQSITSTTYAPLGIGGDPGTDGERGELTSRVVSKLNNDGKVIQIVSYNSSGEKEWEKRHAYRGGKLLKSAQLDAAGKPVFISVYTHNDMGLVLSETATDKNGETVHIIENQYNEENQLIWTTFSSPQSGVNTANRLYYDDQQRLMRDEIIEDKRFIEAVEYAYYPEFHLRLATHYTPEGEVIRKEIENYFGENVFDIGSNKKE